MQFLKELFCVHLVKTKDLRLNPESTGDYDRVMWPCSKCGKVFKANCGLDIGKNWNFDR